MNALSMIEIMFAEIKSLKGDIEVVECATSSRDREAKIEVRKPPMFKGARDA